SPKGVRVENIRCTPFSLEVQHAEARPVAERAMNRAGRSDHRWVVGVRPRRQRPPGQALQKMTPWLIHLLHMAGRTEAGGRHAEWLEQQLPHQVFPRAAGHLLTHGSDDRIAVVGILVLGSQGSGWRLL